MFLFRRLKQDLILYCPNLKRRMCRNGRWSWGNLWDYLRQRQRTLRVVTSPLHYGGGRSRKRQRTAWSGATTSLCKRHLKVLELYASNGEILTAFTSKGCAGV
jgi:hypothetical protein